MSSISINREYNKMDLKQLISRVASHFIFRFEKKQADFFYSETLAIYRRATFFEYQATFASDFKFGLVKHKKYSNQRNAIWYFLHSALKGYSVSQYKLGICYLKGQLGLQPNIKLAEKWLILAANQGHPQAINELKNINLTYFKDFNH